MNFKDAYSSARTNAIEELNALDLNAAYSLGLSKTRDHLQGSHTVVTYPPLDSLKKITNTKFVEELSFPKEINAYIHVPVCDYRCTFCHYLTVHTSQSQKTDLNGVSYLTALKWEISQWGNLLRKKESTICSLYIGGGTPTALPAIELESLLKHVHEALPFSDSPKICIETSPKSLSSQMENRVLEILENNQVNRISLGIQSFHPKALKVSGRYYDSHKTEDIEEHALTILLRSYVNNINIDMIQDLPLPQDVSHFEVLQHDLQKIMKLKPHHITWYNMRLCPESVLKFSHIGDNGKSYYKLNNSGKYYCVPSQKESLLMRLVIWKFMESIGYTVLEGDRFALGNQYEDKFRKARGSVTAGLLGMGVSSYSHIQKTFFRNIANTPSPFSEGGGFLSNFIDAIHNYIEMVEHNKLPIGSLQDIPVNEMVAGCFSLGLKGGVNIENIRSEYGSLDECKSYLSYATSLVNLMTAGGLLEEKCGTIHLTTFGRLFENEICQKFYSPKVRYLGYVNRGITPPTEIHNNYLHYATS